MTLATRYDARLLGATDAIEWLGGLAVVSPVTEHLLAVDFTIPLETNPSLDLDGVIPYGLSVLASGFLVVAGERALVLVGGTLAAPVEARRLSAGVRWVHAIQSIAAVSRRVSHSSAYLRREEAVERRIIDIRSRQLLLVSTSTAVLLLDENLTQLASVCLPAEIAAPDPATGAVFLVSDGNIQIIRLTPEETLEVVQPVGQAFNIRGPVAARVVAGQLYVLCERRKRVLVFNASTYDLTPVSDITGDSAILYWERNTLRHVTAGGVAITRFGSSLATPTDYPITEAETGWKLHGEIAALTAPEFYHAPLPPAQYPAFGIAVSGGYLGAASFAPDPTVALVNYGPGGGPGLFPTSPGTSRHFNHVHATMEDMDLVWSMDFSAGETFGPGGPGDSGGGVVIGHRTLAGVLVGSVNPWWQWPSQLWWDRYVGPVARLQYSKTTGLWTITALHP